MFAERVKKLLKEKKIFAKDMLADLGINKNQMARWEKENSIPKDVLLNAIADYLDTTPAYLRGETDEQKEKPIFEDGQELSEQTIAFSHKLERLTEDERQAVSDFVDLILRQRNGQS